AIVSVAACGDFMRAPTRDPTGSWSLLGNIFTAAPVGHLDRTVVALGRNSGNSILATTPHGDIYTVGGTYDSNVFGSAPSPERIVALSTRASDLFVFAASNT